MSRSRFARAIGAMVVATAIACRGAEGPVGPAGSNAGNPTFISTTGTSPLVVAGDLFRYTQVPGLSTTVTIPAGDGSSLLIETDGGVQVNSADPNESCFVDVAVFIDGAQVGSGRRIPVLNTAMILYSVGTYGFSLETSLTAGTHTVAVMAKRFPSTFAECYVSSGAGGSGLPGNPRLQGVLNVVVFP